MTTFFLRCDDVTAPDAAFRRMAALLLKAELPLSCAVIPALAGRELASFLGARAAAGARLEALQHGLSHAEHAGNRYLKQEFGPARTYQEQYEDIAAGKKLMRGLFGRLSRPVFVPPFHAYNSDTLKALASLKFKGVSASRLPEGRLPRGLVFLGTRVTVNEYDLRLKPRALDLRTLKSRTLAAAKGKGPAGVYFHHADIKGRDFRVFSDYVAFLKDLERRGLARFSLCSELVKRSVQ
jgi:hypothetical protein